jgi:hypothetical protein
LGRPDNPKGLRRPVDTSGEGCRMAGVICGAGLALVSVLAILLYPFSKKGEFMQRYGRVIALGCAVGGIIIALLFAWVGL